MVTLPPPTLLVNGIQANRGHVPLPIVITHGRSRVDAQPDAPSLTMEWAEPATCPQLLDRVELRLNLPAESPMWDDPRVSYDDPTVLYSGTWAVTAVRFVGVVVDVDTQEIWQGSYGGPATSRITAVSTQADLGRVPVVLTRPAEADTARIAAIAAAAGVPITVVGGAGPRLAANTIDRDALGALYEVTGSSGGLLWQGPDGRMHYGAQDYRADAPAVAGLPAGAIVDGLRWQTSAADMINKVTVKWGPPDAQQEHTLTDDASVAAHGIHHAQVGTGLADQAAADQLASLILARRGWPFWWTSDVIIDSALVLEVSTMRAVAVLQTSDTVLLPIPAEPGVTGLLAEWIVEGWVETWPAHDRCVIQIAVSDRERWALTQLRLWSHADDFTWGQELSRGSWFDALILQPDEVAA
jgi:hypothetical protein